MSVMSINHGPFKGAEFDPAEGFNRIQDDGSIVTGIKLAVLTQLFLEKFPPVEGWSVEIQGEFVQVDMVPLPKRDDPLAAATHVPTARFVATLTSPEGRVIGTASTLWTIQGPTDWEKGETNARARLYEAMGLQSRFGEAAEGGDVRRRAPALASVSTIHQPEPVKPVTVTAIVDEAPKAPETTKVVEEEEVKAEESTTDATTRTEPAAEAPDPESTPEKEPEQQPEPKAEAKPKRTKAAAKATKEPEAGPAQSTMDAVDVDPMDLPPPDALVTQCQRLAKLMHREVPELPTRRDAMQFLAELQGR